MTKTALASVCSQACTVATLAIQAVSLCLLTGALLSPPAAAQAREAAWPGPGTHTLSLRHGGREREALVHLPPALQQLRPGQPLPLLMAFHGGGGSMSLQAGPAYGLREKADAAGFIAVFPNGTGAVRAGGALATWNAGSCCRRARDEGVDDVGYVRALLAEVQRRLPPGSVDTQRIYATGMSNGAMMAYHLACEAADLFAGIAAVAGTDSTLHCSPARPVRVLHIHALDDTHVLYEGGAGPDAFRDRSKVSDFRSVPATVSAWARLNQCSPRTETVLRVPGAHCLRHEDCAAGGAVQLCTTDSGGHSWPGGPGRGLRQRLAAQAGGGPSQAISATDLMWDFFSQDAPREAAPRR